MADNRTLTYRSANGHSWGQLELLAADLIDVTQHQTWVIENQNRKHRSPHPKPFPRPESLLAAEKDAAKAKAASNRRRVHPEHLRQWQERLNGPLAARRAAGEKPAAAEAPASRAPSPADVAALHRRAW